MPRNAVFETYAEYSNKMMVRWAMHQERQCLKKRGMQAHEEKMRLEKSRLGYVGAAAANRSNRKLLDGEDDGEAAPAGADENSDTKSVLHAAIHAERASMNGNGGRRYESCPEVDRLMAQKAKQSLWTLNGYHMSLNRDVFRPLDGYNKQRELIHEYETKEPDEFRKVTVTLPRGIACSSSGSLSKRRDLRLAQPDAYFPHDGRNLNERMGGATGTN
mmetsp:Transcript_9671/g.23814  ORF Transcript_9671/g.23814 Transcript_9671/m.23814 type:complete len:217 (-) Transcript_9671:376-1026(-)|eukprot:CAMPEP_0178994788 /NCGR_PEP_ID=MMETSP0795-20121207/7466_1 /TAXON_ID=88552 /ORGANISM="Amoebophrya sp., Strain Ameob2" /LENGTH=216 /DNA_ID=CAMNT_0020687023 /DNA_START=179 /DNA_END=829 /DNA_ORIENTATION=+